MNPAHQPPTVLIIHDGSFYDPRSRQLSDAGLRVSETHADTALNQALRLQPDIIVLDSGCNPAVKAQLKGDSRTQHIPILALSEFAGPPY